jgi:hypothetical protein
MATSVEIEREKNRISERLARVEAERTKLADQLSELEVTERVLTRFGGSADTAAARRRGRPARTAPAAGGQRRARSGKPAPSLSLSDATLQAIRAHPQGATVNEILGHLSREFGMAVRPNEPERDRGFESRFLAVDPKHEPLHRLGRTRPSQRAGSACGCYSATTPCSSAAPISWPSAGCDLRAGTRSRRASRISPCTIRSPSGTD